jgi:hypothetical protein
MKVDEQKGFTKRMKKSSMKAVLLKEIQGLLKSERTL